MLTCHLGHDRTRRQSFFQNPRLLIGRPATPAARTVDHLDTARYPLRVKRKVKSRHKTIPNQRSSASLFSGGGERWGSDDAYTSLTNRLH